MAVGLGRRGITSYRKAAMVLATGTLLIGAEAHAEAIVGTTEDELSAEKDKDKPADEIVVNGTRYRINTLNSRLPDVRDAPQSISIIPREVIEQQAASSLRDVLRNVSGISMAAGEGGGGPAGDNLTLRGFGARNDIFVDGIRDFASYTRDTFNVEQVEVVKGPASAQTGRGSTGGYINLFTKQPQAVTFAGATIGVGAPGFFRATADLNLGGEEFGLGGTALRVNALYHDADTPGRDHVEARRIGFAPSVAFGLGGPTRAILS
ncbi:MAG: TonB-dependent receptor plug domain-containing protein, partial [Pseudomonadota bacterium]|nr:TonB-dependent receptor plug domain-containing protein [Pseudomonadota bacterium]